MVALLAVAGSACASWEGTHFCRLSDDRLVLMAGGQKFVLTHGAAWELADPVQKDSFDKWLDRSKLSKDLGQLVAAAPPDHEVPLAAEIDADVSGAAQATLTFKRNNTLPKVLTLSAAADGAKLDSDGEKLFGGIAKDLGKPASTLLVLLADKAGAISDGKAWAAFLARVKAKPEFVIALEPKVGVLWVRQAQSPPVDTTPSKPTTSTPNSTPPADDQTTETPAKQSSEASPYGMAALGGIFALIVGAGIGYYTASLKRPKSKAPSADGAASLANRFNVTAHERELVEKVRDEIGKLGWSANHVPSGDEFVVGQMIDRYNRSQALADEVERLQSYRQFKEDHDSFQRKIDVAVAESKASASKAADLAGLLEQEREKSHALAGDLGQTQDARRATAANLRQAEQRIKDLELKNVEFQTVYAELVNRTAAVCHDIVITRPRGDAWALAFAYLVDYTLANLGLARQCNDARTFDAMLTNLRRLADAMAKSFPDRKLVIDPWKRAVNAFGEVKPPTYEQKPHPHVDSLSQIVLTLRDTGPSLAEFREFFAPSESGLHIIRPA